MRCCSHQPGLELLKRDAGSKLTQPGVSAAPTRHSLTISTVKENTGRDWAALSFRRGRGALLVLQKDTRRGSLGSWRRPSRWNSPGKESELSHTFLASHSSHILFSCVYSPQNVSTVTFFTPCGWWSTGCHTFPQTEIHGCCCWSSWCHTCSLRVTRRWL